MNTPDPTLESHDFSHETLTNTFTLLRDKKPSLALIIQNTLTAHQQRHPEEHHSKPITINLSPTRIATIVHVLSDIASKKAEDKTSSKELLLLIRNVILDWLVFAQSCSENPLETPDVSEPISH